MTFKQFLLEMDEILDLPAGTVRGNENLEDLANWDSTALVNFLVLAESSSGVSPSLAQIASCTTVSDLVRLSHISDAN